MCKHRRDCLLEKSAFGSKHALVNRFPLLLWAGVDGILRRVTNTRLQIVESKQSTKEITLPAETGRVSLLPPRPPARPTPPLWAHDRGDHKTGRTGGETPCLCIQRDFKVLPALVWDGVPGLQTGHNLSDLAGSLFFPLLLLLLPHLLLPPHLLLQQPGYHCKSCDLAKTTPSRP